MTREIAGRFSHGRCRIAFHGEKGRRLVDIAAGLPFSRSRIGSSAFVSRGANHPAVVVAEAGSAVLHLAASRSARWTVEVFSARRAGNRQGPAMAGLLEDLSPVLLESLSLSRRLERGEEPRVAEMQANWDPLPYAACLVSETLHPLFVNIAGEEILSTRSLFRIPRRGASLRPAQEGLEEALESAAYALASGRRRVSDFVTIHPDTGCRLLVRLARIGRSPIDPSSAELQNPPLVLTIRQLSVSTNTDRTTPARTPVEARLASEG